MVALTGISADRKRPGSTRQRSLSTALVQELQRRLTVDIAGDTTPGDGPE